MSSAATENGITRRVFLPWEKSPGCRGRLGQRSYSLLGLSSWQAKNNSITKSQLYTAKTILASVEGQKKPVKKKKNQRVSFSISFFSPGSVSMTPARQKRQKLRGYYCDTLPPSLSAAFPVASALVSPLGLLAITDPTALGTSLQCTINTGCPPSPTCSQTITLQGVLWCPHTKSSPHLSHIF